MSNKDTNLRKLRLKKGLSQHELSELSGVSIHTVRAYEYGNRNVNHARIHTLQKLSAALECGINELVEGPAVIAYIPRKEIRP